MMEKKQGYKASRRFLLTGLGNFGAAGGMAALSSGKAAAQEAIFTLPKATAQVTPFKVDFAPALLDDLKDRLADVRWPEQESVDDWSQGVPMEKLRALTDYWQSRYDFTRLQKSLNAYPQFRTEIDGLGIHFLHVRSKHENAMPLVLTHGWPGSVVEFLKVIGPLTDPEAHGGKADDAFHLVIPSLPGFGFTDKPAQKGWNLARTANAWGTLMQRLGYKKWVAQGGDWGAGLTTMLGHIKPTGLAGIHLNWAFVFPEKLPKKLSAEERRAVDAVAAFQANESGYFMEQTTRPQTVGYALSDSPLGQAAWIYEKFHAWTDNDGNVESALNLDEMLDNITLYWLTGTAASSARIYWENSSASFSGGKLDLPVAVSIFPKEIYRAPRSWAEQTYSQLIYWNELSKGGHFAAFEQPQLFVNELRAAFATLR